MPGSEFPTRSPATWRTMKFNWRGFARFTRNGLFEARDTHYRLTLHRIGWAIAFYTFFPLLELATWGGFLLDDLLFRGYRKQQVHGPVFIIGNPRSGTTFLQRLMSRDVDNFTAMKTWEILFAPSITQRRFWHALSALDDRLGGHVKRWAKAAERRYGKELVTHRLSLDEPEEDEFILLHIWSTVVINVFSAVMDEALAYTHFDRALPRAEKERITAFYRQCVKRHAFARGVGDGRYHLAKSPCFSPKMEALGSAFPDAKFIYLVRNPLDVVPSYMSLLDLQWSILADPLEKWAGRDYVLEMIRHWYTYPLERLATAPPDRYAIVRYDDLVTDAERTLAEVYGRLGLEMSPQFARLLHAAAERERHYVSDHRYSLESMGLTRERLVSVFHDIIERFGFDTEESSVQTEVSEKERTSRHVGETVAREGDLCRTDITERSCTSI
jgi:hypothetical protein